MDQTDTVLCAKTTEFGSVPGNRFCTAEGRITGRVTQAMVDAVTNFDLTSDRAFSTPIMVNQQQRLWDFVKEEI